eukprot:4398562-Amphidinium_carterae.1
MHAALKEQIRIMLHTSTPTEGGDNREEPTAYDLIFLLPKLLWAVPPGHAPRARLDWTRQSGVLLGEQDWQALFHRAGEFSPASTSYEKLDERPPAALLKFAKRGQPMRAFHAISSLGLATTNDATRNTVHKLLGSTLLTVDVPPEVTEWCTVMHDHSFESATLAGLAKSLLRMKRNKTFDHHGWTAESARILLANARVWQCAENWLTLLQQNATRARSPAYTLAIACRCASPTMGCDPSSSPHFGPSSLPPASCLRKRTPWLLTLVASSVSF